MAEDYPLSDKRHPDNYSDDKYAATYAQGDGWCGPPADVLAAAEADAASKRKEFRRG